MKGDTSNIRKETEKKLKLLEGIRGCIKKYERWRRWDNECKVKYNYGRLLTQKVKEKV